MSAGSGSPAPEQRIDGHEPQVAAEPEGSRDGARVGLVATSRDPGPPRSDRPRQTVGMVSLGCPKNLVDGEVMLGLARDAGHEITSDAATADVIVVNTCARRFRIPGCCIEFIRSQLPVPSFQLPAWK